MKENRAKGWTLEIVPSHAEKVSLFAGLVDEIYITMIPGSPVEDCHRAAGKVLESGFLPVPHVAARNFQREQELDEFFRAIRSLGLPKVLLLAGGQSEPGGPYGSSFDLIESESFRRAGLKSVALAGHPEGNPEDAQSYGHLIEKCRLLRGIGLCPEVVTQWSFCPEKTENYLEALANEGLDIPIRVGVPGPASMKTLLKYAQICGVSASTTALKKQGLSMSRLLFANKPDKFVSQVRRARHFHLYPFGGLETCAEWLKSRPASELASTQSQLSEPLSAVSGS